MAADYRRTEPFSTRDPVVERLFCRPRFYDRIFFFSHMAFFDSSDVGQSPPVHIIIKRSTAAVRSDILSGRVSEAPGGDKSADPADGRAGRTAHLKDKGVQTRTF